MKIDNIGGRAAATVCALALGAGGTSLLFGDVIFGAAEFAQTHFQTICIVIATTTAWMAVTHAFKSGHYLACLGFLVLALAGSCVIGWNSLGRQTEGQMLSTDEHDKNVKERNQVEQDLADERETLKTKKKEADAACKNRIPEHSKCSGPRATVAFYETSVKGYEARLKVLTVKPANASAEALGNLTNAIGRNGTKAKALSMLFMPIAITILFEYGFTLALHYIVRPVRRPKIEASKPQTELASVSEAELAKLREAFETEASNPSDDEGGTKVIELPKRPKPSAPSNRPNRRMTREEIRTDLMLRNATDRQFGSQKEAAEYYGYSESRYSELSKAWESEGLIPARRMVGRTKQLEKA